VSFRRYSSVEIEQERSRGKQAEGGNTVATLLSRLDQFKKAFESGAPAHNGPREAIDTMHRATAEFNASGLADKTLKVGDRAPDFILFNQDRLEVTSSELLRQGSVIASFFRGYW
jgi:hypothetical protein